MTDELISKTDVIKIIKSVLSPASSLIHVPRARRQILNEINELESKPEIVRCKDCEHGVLDDGFPHQYFCVFKCDEWNNADYFCGHAERREVTT